VRAHPAVARSPLALVASPSLSRRSPPPTRGSATRRLKPLGRRSLIRGALARRRRHHASPPPIRRRRNGGLGPPSNTPVWPHRAAASSPQRRAVAASSSRRRRLPAHRPPLTARRTRCRRAAASPPLRRRRCSLLPLPLFLLTSLPHRPSAFLVPPHCVVVAAPSTSTSTSILTLSCVPADPTPQNFKAEPVEDGEEVDLRSGLHSSA